MSKSQFFSGIRQCKSLDNGDSLFEEVNGRSSVILTTGVQKTLERINECTLRTISGVYLILDAAICEGYLWDNGRLFPQILVRAAAGFIPKIPSSDEKRNLCESLP